MSTLSLYIDKDNSGTHPVTGFSGPNCLFESESNLTAPIQAVIVSRSGLDAPDINSVRSCP